MTASLCLHTFILYILFFKGNCILVCCRQEALPSENPVVAFRDMKTQSNNPASVSSEDGKNYQLPIEAGRKGVVKPFGEKTSFFPGSGE